MVTLSDILLFFREKNNIIVEPGINLNLNTPIKGGKNIQEAGTQEISFLSAKYKDSFEKILSSNKAPVVILDSLLWNNVKGNKFDFYLVISESPKSAIVECLKFYFEEKIIPGIHPSAIVHPEAKIGNNNFIGAFTIIDKDVVIGNDCIIEPHVNIRSNCIIGNNVFIKSGTVIGGKGFGYVKKEDDTWENFPHFGKVIIEDNVEIGSNSCIDRGALGDTILKKGVKVDNLVHIAHNVVVGENSLLIADSMIGGSTIIGKNTWVAPSTALRNGITIGSDCVIGMGAIVTKSVENGMTVVGNPAVPFLKKK